MPTTPRTTEIARHAPAERLVRLGLALADSRGGLTISEMARLIGVGRRTAERLRASLDGIVGGMEWRRAEDGQKRWTLPAVRFNAFGGPTPDELGELKLLTARKRAEGHAASAELLDRLIEKIERILPRSTVRRMEPDLDLLLETHTVLVRPGPRAQVAPEVIDALRGSILASHEVRLAYRRRDTGKLSRPVLQPYGFLAGSRDYLVGFNPHPRVREHRLYVMSGIEAVEVSKRNFARDPDFDLAAFAARSFGAFWDGERHDVVWRFKPGAASDARAFRFHPDQILTEEPDGSVIVRFRASGLTEMAWHLFTWGDTVEILAPAELRDRYRELIALGRAALDGASGGTQATPPMTRHQL